VFPTYSVPTRIFTGLGCRSLLGGHIRTLGGTRVALVGDAGLERLGALIQFEASIANAPNVALVSVSLSGVDPTIAEAEAAAQLATRESADIVVGVGGGSTLSLAKAVSLLLTNPAPIAQYAGIGNARQRPAPCIAVPTTAGSGSEVSNAFVLHDSSSAINIGMRGWGYEPDIALLDGELLTGLPHTAMRDAAVDALSHGFEALWAKGATRFSDDDALASIRLICSIMPRALTERRPDDLQALLEASTMANFACGNAGLGLVHALSSATTIRVPHGRQNGIFLPIVAEYNRSVVSAATAVEIERLTPLYRLTNIPTTFEPGELGPNAVDLICEAAMKSPFRLNNARDASADELRQLALLSLPSESRSARGTQL
jgi:alcohol dehydrogenase class IV